MVVSSVLNIYCLLFPGGKERRKREGEGGREGRKERGGEGDRNIKGREEEGSKNVLIEGVWGHPSPPTPPALLPMSGAHWVDPKEELPEVSTTRRVNTNWRRGNKGHNQ